MRFDEQTRLLERRAKGGAPDDISALETHLVRISGKTLDIIRTERAGFELVKVVSITNRDREILIIRLRKDGDIHWFKDVVYCCATSDLQLNNFAYFSSQILQISPDEVLPFAIQSIRNRCPVDVYFKESQRMTRSGVPYMYHDWRGADGVIYGYQ